MASLLPPQAAMAAMAAAAEEEEEWSFKDDAGNVHGFFDAATVRAWAVAGYLTSDTEVQRRSAREAHTGAAEECPFEWLGMVDELTCDGLFESMWWYRMTPDGEERGPFGIHILRAWIGAEMLDYESLLVQCASAGTGHHARWQTEWESQGIFAGYVLLQDVPGVFSGEDEANREWEARGQRESTAGAVASAPNNTAATDAAFAKAEAEPVDSLQHASRERPLSNQRMNTGDEIKGMAVVLAEDEAAAVQQELAAGSQGADGLSEAGVDVRGLVSPDASLSDRNKSFFEKMKAERDKKERREAAEKARKLAEMDDEQREAFLLKEAEEAKHAKNQSKMLKKQMKQFRKSKIKKGRRKTQLPGAT